MFKRAKIKEQEALINEQIVKIKEHEDKTKSSEAKIEILESQILEFIMCNPELINKVIAEEYFQKSDYFSKWYYAKKSNSDYFECKGELYDVSTGISYGSTESYQMEK